MSSFIAAVAAVVAIAVGASVALEQVDRSAGETYSTPSVRLGCAGIDRRANPDAAAECEGRLGQ